MRHAQPPSLCEIRRTIGDCLNDIDGTAGIATALNELSTLLYCSDSSNPKGISTLITLLEDKLRSVDEELRALCDSL